MTAISPGGAIIGTYYDESLAEHGFLRDPQGNFTTLDISGAEQTVPEAINAAGQITGWYTKLSAGQHGFLRDL